MFYPVHPLAVAPAFFHPVRHLASMLAMVAAVFTLALPVTAAAETVISFETGIPGSIGTEIGESYAGVGAHFFNAYFRQCSACPTPMPGTMASSDDFNHPMSVVFDGVASFVSVSNVSDSSWIMDAFDFENDFIGTISSSTFEDTQEIFAPGGIHSVHFRAGGPGLLYGIDNFTFQLTDVAIDTNHVPEPGTLALVLAGLMAAPLARQLRRQP